MSDIDTLGEDSPLRDHAKTILKMTKEAKHLEKKLNAEAVIVIAVFKDGNQLRLQDAGKFFMPPDQFYDVMQQAHKNGQMGSNSPKLKQTSRIIKPH